MYAVPRVGELVLTHYNTRFSDRQRVLGTVALCFADPSRADEDVVAAGIELAAWRRSLPDPEAEFLGAARSLLRVLRGRREYDRIMRELRVPVLLIHGTHDRLVPISAARRAARLNPAWRTAYLDGGVTRRSSRRPRTCSGTSSRGSTRSAEGCRLVRSRAAS